MRKIIQLIFVTCMFFCLAFPVYCVSICSSDKNLNFSARTICKNAHLKNLDEKLEKISHQSHLKSISKDNVTWRMKYVERCEIDPQCIEKEYVNRIETLVMHSSLGAQENVVSWCSALSLNATEIAICLHSNLRVLEIALEDAYGRVKAEKKDFAQQYWLRNVRDVCHSDLTCIKSAYQQRIAELVSKAN